MEVPVSLMSFRLSPALAALTAFRTFKTVASSTAPASSDTLLPSLSLMIKRVLSLRETHARLTLRRIGITEPYKSSDGSEERGSC